MLGHIHDGYQIIRHGRIVTTLARAKAVRKRVDHMITLSKDGSLHARRQVSVTKYPSAMAVPSRLATVVALAIASL